MQTIDWKELKDGDIFKVVGASSTRSSNEQMALSLTYGADTAYQRVGRGWILAGAEEANPWGNVTPATHGHIKLAVQKFEPDEATGTVMQSLTSRVGDYTGSDPEIFVVHGEKGSLLPAYRFLPTEKDAKKNKTLHNEKAIPYRDGFAAETAVEQRSCHEQVMVNIKVGLVRILQAARTYDRTAKLTIQNTFRIPKVTMDNATDDQVAFGCSPSLNAYGVIPELPHEPRNFMYRFAGGHVHLATRTTSQRKKEEMVKGCDLIAGIASVALFENYDTPARRQFYGRAGEYRTPSYGLEYRTLSNAWLGHPAVAHLCLNLVRVGAKVGSYGHLDYFGVPPEGVQDIINNCDVKAARAFVGKHRKIYEQLLRLDGAPCYGNTFRDIIEGGVHSMFSQFGQMENVWALNGQDAYWHTRWQNVTGKR